LKIVAAVLLLSVLFFGARRAGIFPAMLGDLAPGVTGQYTWSNLGYWLFLFLGPLLTALFAWVWWRRPNQFQTAAHCCSPIPRLYWIVPALLIFDGLTPYLGLKTETAFAMYSNLRTEGNGETNHLIWRHRLDLADYQRDLVRIMDSNDDVLEVDARWGAEIPYYVLRKRVADLVQSGKRGIRVTYVRGGNTIRLDRAETVPELAAMPSWLERKTLRFRTIDSEGCAH